ncbi:MAG: hypothetical protein LC104_22140 [Bacteroidales bacterium]|nr:hypothetical protein [Bacteroidales bacterium]
MTRFHNPDPERVLVVVSYSAGRPIEPLRQLLSDMAEYPAGHPVDIRVVVNGKVSQTPACSRLPAGVDVLERAHGEHTPGAWEEGWRTPPHYTGYLFLQDDCRIVQSDWVGGFVRVAHRPGVGLVGECRSPNWDAAWPVLVERFRGEIWPEHVLDGQPLERVAFYREHLRRSRIPEGIGGDHLQALILYARRAILERVGGFPMGDSSGETVAAEIGLSKRIQAAGLALTEVGPEPFFYIEHSQWLHRRTSQPLHELRVGGHHA